MSTTKQKICFTGALAGSLLLSAAASESFGAVDLTPPFSVANVSASGNHDGVVTSDSETTHAAVSSLDGSASGTADVNLAHTTLTEHAQGSGTSPFTAGAISSSELEYEFAVVGPNTVNVPVWVRAGITIDFSHTTGPGSEGDGFVQITQSNGPDIEISTCYLVTGPCGGANKPNVFVNTEATFQSNEPINIDMRGSADGTEGAADTIVDPYFFIDPAFLAANPGYSLTFPDGIGNAFIGLPGTVPEPATWIMLMLGFGAIGATLRTQRRARQAC